MGTPFPVSVDEDRLRWIESYIEEHELGRQGNKILHGFPPPLLWREHPVPVEDALELRRRTEAEVPKRLLVYVSTPYCLPTEPERCGFCLFPSEVYRNRAQLDEYLGYLELEGRMYQGPEGHRFDRAAFEALYFGGGTANLYRPEQYPRLLGIVRDVLGDIPPGVEVTLEGVPQLFTREKLAAMRDAGVNRISIGVQQLGDELIALSGRKQKAEQVFRTIEWCRELGLPCSVDLIFGWPRQTVEDMLCDLEAIAATGIGHLTHYELNVAGRSAFALRYRDELPSRQTNLEMYRLARAWLEDAGFRQTSAYDWRRCEADLATDYRFEDSWHRPLRSSAPGETSGVDLWGWGFAGVSCFPGSPRTPGWTWIQHTRVGHYIESLDRGEFPVERGHRFSPRDLRLNVLFQMLNGMSVEIAELRRLFGVDLLSDHAELWLVLMRRGWVALDGERLHLVGDGVFHTPLIQTLLARPETSGPT